MTTVTSAACYTGVDAPVIEACTDAPFVDGDWQPDEVEDWRNPGTTGPEELDDACGIGGTLRPHHCFITAVHAVHMHTGELLLMHVPCEGDTAEVLVWFGFEGVAVQDSPPTVAITVPGSVTCPSEVSLTKSLGDAESDLAGFRWSIDGVLVDHATTAVEFTEPHVLALVAWDERGGARTEKKTVGCL